MPGGHEMDAELAGGVESGLGRLAGQEGVVAVRGGSGDVLRGAAADDRDAFDPRRPAVEDQGLAIQPLAHARGERLDRGRLGQSAADADLRAASVMSARMSAASRALSGPSTVRGSLFQSRP
jgi:hypothetical protein